AHPARQPHGLLQPRHGDHRPRRRRVHRLPAPQLPPGADLHGRLRGDAAGIDDVGGRDRRRRADQPRGDPEPPSIPRVPAATPARRRPHPPARRYGGDDAAPARERKVALPRRPDPHPPPAPGLRPQPPQRRPHHVLLGRRHRIRRLGARALSAHPRGSDRARRYRSCHHRHGATAPRREREVMTGSYIRTPELLALIRKVFKALLVVTVVVGGLGIAIGTIAFGLPGLWAALIATVLGLFFTATTVAGLYYAAGRGQELLMVVLLGGWLVKMIILGGVIFWLKNQTFYHKGTFAATILTLVIGALIVEMVIVATARIPHVSVNSVTTDSASGSAPDSTALPQPQQHAETEESQGSERGDKAGEG